MGAIYYFVYEEQNEESKCLGAHRRSISYVKELCSYDVTVRSSGVSSYTKLLDPTSHAEKEHLHSTNVRRSA
jgi:hypothetical protein